MNYDNIGNLVFAIGTPFYNIDTVSKGIISSKNRILSNSPYVDFIQTDAAINPGNSGGPLLNVNRKVIGINNLILSKSGGSNVQVMQFKVIMLKI